MASNTSDESLVRMQGEEQHLVLMTILNPSIADPDYINPYTSRPKCLPGSSDPGVTIVNPTEISVMYGYVT